MDEKDCFNYRRKWRRKKVAEVTRWSKTYKSDTQNQNHSLWPFSSSLNMLLDWIYGIQLSHWNKWLGPQTVIPQSLEVKGKGFR